MNAFFYHKPLKGTSVVISKKLPFEKGHTRFTTVPFKPFSDHKRGRYIRFYSLKGVYC